jgi:hypothetical protein
MTSGKYYWEVNVNNSSNVDIVGISSMDWNGNPYNTYVGGHSASAGYGYGTSTGNWYANGFTSDGTTPSAFPSSGIIGVAFDADNGKLYFSRNNTWINSADPSAGTGANFTATTTQSGYLPAISTYNNQGTWSANFGQFAFAYTPPTGYKKLNTYNLPDSSITDGSQYFDTITYTGTGADNTISTNNIDLSTNGLTWFKSRSVSNNHYLMDSLRTYNNGGTLEPYWQALSSNLTAAESATGNIVNSVTSSTLTKAAGDTLTNASGTTYVGWLWQAGSSAVSNTDGTITSTVSANTTSGFSVVTYVGTAAVATVGHGLGVAPSMIITKNRDTTTDWWVYHAALGNTKYMVLNTTAASVTSSAAWNNTSPTSTVFTLGGAGNPSNANQDVAYCFAEVEGFSKFGSYTGNGSTDGTFIYTGFRPAFVMVKRTDTTQYWGMYDSARDTYNQVYKAVFANTSAAEDATSSDEHDFLSNGFKMRNTGGSMNASGGTYIFMAFAENPFKNSLAR